MYLSMDDPARSMDPVIRRCSATVTQSFSFDRQRACQTLLPNYSVATMYTLFPLSSTHLPYLRFLPFANHAIDAVDYLAKIDRRLIPKHNASWLEMASLSIWIEIFGASSPLLSMKVCRVSFDPSLSLLGVSQKIATTPALLPHVEFPKKERLNKDLFLVFQTQFRIVHHIACLCFFQRPHHKTTQHLPRAFLSKL